MHGPDFGGEVTTAKFYLLRDFLVCGECGNNLSGRIDINTDGTIDNQVYYCSKKERDWKKGAIEQGEKWKRGKVGDRGCGMNRSLNIPLTDKMVWDLVVDVVSNSKMLKEVFKSEVLKTKLESDEENEARRKKEEANQNRLKKKLDDTKTTLADVETKRLLGEYDDLVLFNKIQNNLKQEIEKTQRQLEQSKLRVRELGNQKKWLDWVEDYGVGIELITKFPLTRKKQYLEGLIERIEVKLDKETLNHHLKVFFRMGLVDDKIEYKNPKKKSEGYEVFEGKKDKSLVIHRADVLALRKKARAEGRREQVKKKRMKIMPRLTVEQNASTTVE